MNRGVFAVVVIFTLVLSFLTISVIVKTGPDILSIAALGIIGVFVFGLFNAMRESRR